MIDIVLASNNEGKMKEYEELLEGYPISLHLLKDLNIVSDPKEDGKTYIENALIKANAIKDKTNYFILADDSGVEFEALGEHFPGINTHRYAIENGADEIDMVINVGWLKDQKYELIQKEISSVVGAAGDKIVKVILETGLLTDDEIVKAVKISCDAGAKFVKTCTGFSDGKATAHAVKLMKQSVSGGVLVKASGGIRTYSDAVTMIEAGADRLGTSSGVAIIRESEQTDDRK